MSDIRADPLPEQTPSSPESPAGNKPDPLAGDWSEGLPGPIRAHGLPEPVRIGEAREDSWAMSPPATDAPSEPVWTPQAHDAGFSPVPAPAPEAFTAQGSEPEPWREKETSPWSAPAQAAAEWNPAATAAEEQWSAPADAPAVQEWPAAQEEAPRALAEEEAAALLQPVEEDRPATFLRPVEQAANDEPPGEPISILHPPGDPDPALQPIMDPTLQPVTDGESVVMLNPHDHPDLLVPVDEDAPPMASGGSAAPSIVPGEHRVAIQTRGGRTRRGSVTDLDLARPQFALQPQGGGSTELVPHAEVKAIFFMLAPGEPLVEPEGGKVRVTFSDGRTIEGHRAGGDGPQGFFLVPLDAQRTNTKRIYIARAAVAALVDLV